ncbi:MAG: phage portal protein [Bacteroidales bacterium]|nr:phage portal protein [Bacteroidales bacterium]MBQ6177891.1 phage portal protein [Bacteroidales bacterium]
MNQILTYQDWLDLDEKDRDAALFEAAEEHRRSAAFRQALDADAYYRGENAAVARKTLLRADRLETRDENGCRRVRPLMQDVVGNRIGSSFLRRFVAQQTQYLLGNGCSLATPEMKKRLGTDFDRVLAQMGEKALLHGVCWGFWNVDHVEAIEVARNPLSGFLVLPDERTGEARLGVQYWQLARQRPMYLRVFTEEGLRFPFLKDGQIADAAPPRPYRLLRTVSALGTEEEGAAWPALPLIPFRANADGRSEFTPSIRAKIDAYDRILSDFADNLDRANDVYWVLNNFSGTAEDVAETLAEIQRLKAVASYSDGTGTSSTAEPHTIDVPYAARAEALRLLEKALYRDWMALDMGELTGGSLTNVAIRAATSALDQKADSFEWEAFRFVRGLLRLLGEDTDEIRFRRARIANESETVADIAAMRGDIDRRTALRLNPYLQPEEAEALIAEKG